MRILFEVSALEDSPSNALKHYEIEFTEPVNADWLIHVIRQALDAAERSAAPDSATSAPFPVCEDCGEVWKDHVCPLTTKKHAARTPVTFVNTFLLVSEPWVCIARDDSERSYSLTPSSLARLVDALNPLSGYFYVDCIGWTWRRHEDVWRRYGTTTQDE